MRPRLDLRHLELLQAIANESTLADAARALRVTPSALSHRIREAERRLDITLFEKRGRILRSTPAADILTDASRRLLSDLAQAETLAIGSAKGVHHVVHLTVAVYNAFHWLPDFLSEFRETHPDIEIEVDANAVLSPFEALLEDSIDIVLTPGTIFPGSATAVPLFEDELAAMSAPTHAFAGRDFVSAEDFESETYFTYSFVRQPGFEGERVWDGRAYPAREVRVGSIEAICELIKAEQGVSILSRWALWPYLQWSSIRATQVTEDGLPIQWNAVLRATSGRKSPERRTAEALQAWFQRQNTGLPLPAGAHR
ncbi:LysR family transcriptional regulator [Ovoidimarina sediminis]|uniref:LysR family transcriptional regulator n=1 Tax=Ovoidimarina sediminis TaxID=3079856 RepID=UPI0029127153|nr:LysR family transcriptional regulator [Rhodophyticola sp. MJ-SS7]MDU8943458.1 LysR family transcriptional regulator [Rhodophyticola sp. MJ-SS7]